MLSSFYDVGRSYIYLSLIDLSVLFDNHACAAEDISVFRTSICSLSLILPALGSASIFCRGNSTTFNLFSAFLFVLFICIQIINIIEVSLCAFLG